MLCKKLLFLIFQATSIFGVDIYPMEECSLELELNNKCLRDATCARVDEDDRQCMCHSGQILSPTLHCVDCDLVSNLCGANSACVDLTSKGLGHKCVCNAGYVRNFTMNNGECTKCINGLSGFHSFCGVGTCKNEQCECDTGYLTDPVNNTCINCNNPWHPDIICGETYTNTTCYRDVDQNNHRCLCPLGEAYNAAKECVQCHNTTAPCRPNWYCKKGMTLKYPPEEKSKCFELCSSDQDCDTGNSNKICAQPDVDLGNQRVCRCREGYDQFDDGTCRSSQQSIGCYYCNGTDDCKLQQLPRSNYYEMCNVGDSCWTYINFNYSEEFRNFSSSYLRMCHPNPCSKPDDLFCMVNEDDPNHSICITCCTIGLCNWHIFLKPINSGSIVSVFIFHVLGAFLGKLLF